MWAVPTWQAKHTGNAQHDWRLSVLKTTPGKPARTRTLQHRPSPSAGADVTKGHSPSPPATLCQALPQVQSHQPQRCKIMEKGQSRPRAETVPWPVPDSPRLLRGQPCSGACQVTCRLVQRAPMFWLWNPSLSPRPLHPYGVQVN